MIDKIANNKISTEKLNLSSISEIKEKLGHYRLLFNKTQDLQPGDFEELKNDISTFFNLKPGSTISDPPKQLVRISNNNRVLESQGLGLGFLTNISQLLAPPIQHCQFGRCNLPGQQVLYCAETEAGAYWETKPTKGDVITLSRFELLPDKKVICNVIKKEKTKDPTIDHELREVYYLLEEFFVDIYSLEVESQRPRDYLFSALLSSDQLFYPVVSDNNIEAIIYPSVQKKKYGYNFAMRNDLIFDRYRLHSVETRFILEEYKDIDPKTENLTADQIIASFGTTKFDFDSGKILYREDKANELFKLFRDLQTGTGKQTRFEYPDVPKNLSFNLAPTESVIPSVSQKSLKIGRNEKVNVVYQDGTRKDNMKFKLISSDVESGKCRVVKY